ncbi:MAG TPA: hypothetical protein VE732_02085 [Nitrososphaera sp.]|jgi:hypothetical protein|nr:hypothetical protein [Nitrososphaera sp.]
MADFKMSKFSDETFFIFSELADYVWKMREHLDHLIIKEKEITLSGFSGSALRLRQGIEEWKHNQLFPNALHYSFIMLLFITVEERLKKICDLVQQKKNLPLRSKDLRGDSIEQGMIFLDKLAGISRDDIKHWPKITDLLKIRNCIVHTSGRIEFSRDKAYLKELIQKNPEYLKLSAHNPPEDKVLIVEHPYCMQSTKDAQEFFEEICEKAGIE